MIEHTIEKINGDWYIWDGNPRVLRVEDAVAGPFSKRYQVLEAASQRSMARILEGPHGDQS